MKTLDKDEEEINENDKKLYLGIVTIVTLAFLGVEYNSFLNGEIKIIEDLLGRMILAISVVLLVVVVSSWIFKAMETQMSKMYVSKVAIVATMTLIVENIAFCYYM